MSARTTTYILSLNKYALLVLAKRNIYYFLNIFFSEYASVWFPYQEDIRYKLSHRERETEGERKKEGKKVYLSVAVAVAGIAAVIITRSPRLLAKKLDYTPVFACSR